MLEKIMHRKEDQKSQLKPANLQELRNYLIALGLICQGFAWELGLMPIVFIALWVLALRLRRAERFITERTESAIFIIFLIASTRLPPSFGHVWFLSLGNTLAVIQLIRAMWPLKYREKVLSSAIAITHIAIGSQAVYDYRFAVILIIAIILIPGTLMELEMNRFGRASLKGRELLNWRMTFAIFTITVLFFISFPRFQLIPVSTRLGLRAGFFNPELDNTRGAAGNGERLIFRVEGETVGYLRSFALDIYNKNKWVAGRAILSPKRRPFSNDLTGTLYRHITIISPSVLGFVLPVDGYITHLAANNLRRPYVAEHGGVVIPFSFRRPFRYEYWTLPGHVKEELSPQQRQRYLKIPDLNPSTLQWLGQLLEGVHTPESQAEILVNHFHTNFTYRLGAPDLNRLSPLEEFLFEKREGHCERFASALAILLRASGIPSRVVLGYLPVERNPIGGFYNVRERHAHAWTEGWFPQKGWVALDATPFGSGIGFESRGISHSIYEWIEYVWYSKILDFGKIQQLRILSGICLIIRGFIDLILKNLNWVINSLGILLLLTISTYCIYLWQRGKIFHLKRKKALQGAHHFYGQMLSALGKKGFIHMPNQTPNEYLHYIENSGHPLIQDIRLITMYFCRVHYGNSNLSDSQRLELESALRKIRGDSVHNRLSD